MKLKALGKCPWCGKNVRGIIIEENYVRRDVCLCPECKEKILICRIPGCTNYAKGGDIWDDDTCPECAKATRATAIAIATPVCIALLKDVLKTK